MASVMFNFIVSNKVILPSQHGFLPKRSVETADIVFYNLLMKKHDIGNCVDVLLLNFAKAFGKVPEDDEFLKFKIFFCL